MDLRQQSLGEEIANSVTHGAGLVTAIGGAPVLIFGAARAGAASLVGATVFATTMILLYLASSLYHALPSGQAKRIFLKLDHGSIYLFIAGSYTPFALGALGGPWGWTLFGLVWALWPGSGSRSSPSIASSTHGCRPDCTSQWVGS